MALVGNMPAGWIFSAFSIGRNQLPYAALALLAGGNIRVGLEDNLWLEQGRARHERRRWSTRARAVGRGDGRARARPGRGAREAQPPEALGLSMTIGPCAVLGGGVIGAGWVARLIENGLDVAVFDPAPDAQAKLDEVLANADRAYAKLTIAPRRREGRRPPRRLDRRRRSRAPT